MAKGSRISVAELAGKFTCQATLPSENEASKPVRRRPPRTLPLLASNNVSQGQDEKAEVGSHQLRKNRNSALIEKLQASLSPTALLPSPLSPGAGKQPPFFPPHSPCSPVSPTSAPKPSQLETPASFETPTESLMLPSINKSRARHSIKRRPPSRRLRQSVGDEGGSEEENVISPVSESSAPDGKENDVFQKKEDTDGTDLPSATSKQQQDQQQNEAAVDSGQQPVTSPGRIESRETFVSAEKEEETVEEEKKSEHPEVDSSKEEVTKQEPDEEIAKKAQSEPATENDKLEQEVKTEEESGGM